MTPTGTVRGLTGRCHGAKLGEFVKFFTSAVDGVPRP